MRDKILILGAAGFIGTNLSLRLLNEGKSLVLFDRPGQKYPSVIGTEKGKAPISFIEGSFSNMKKGDWLQYDSLLEETETVYHLISTTCPSNSNLDIGKELQDNVSSTASFLDACVACKVTKVVFLSSGGTVYGKEHSGECSEEQETFPISAYGMQKLGIEKLLYLYRHLYGLDYRIVRLSNPFGPYQKTNGVQGVIATFLWKILREEPITVYGDGSVVRDYIYIDDAIEGILKISNEKDGFRLYNLGSGKGYSISQIIDFISKTVKKEPQIVYANHRDVDVPCNILRIDRYRKQFGEPIKTSIEEGIRKLADFYQSGEW